MAVVSTFSRATYSEVALEVNHLGLHNSGIQHGDGSLLEGVVGTTIEVTTARADALYKLAKVNCQWLLPSTHTH